jgi:thioredoxin-like negative regulator of GroEL
LTFALRTTKPVSSFQNASPEHGLRLPVVQILSPTENALAMKVPIP